MPDLKLDLTTGNLARLNGDLCLTDDVSGETTQQRVLIRLRLFLGEWFLDTRKGTPYFEQIFVRNPNLGAIEASLKAVILETPGVVRLLSYSQTYDASARSLSVDFEAEAEGGESIVINEVLTP